ncbi:hypothetical protein [Pelagicoccus mobilis]|uniref:Uncharacterized protein n=1 Tax=Pelagicoccus mobilis TaxID=415221 RepID=A0A934RU01_9BACT|nr:hypothetical protein [Pelagicoccus mobilis]MBK1876842.1 hypothetical protein [Pelagicoccus mobilis]
MLVIFRFLVVDDDIDEPSGPVWGVSARCSIDAFSGEGNDGAVGDLCMRI